MPEMETVDFETDLSLFKYDNLEQLPPAYRDLAEAERAERIEVVVLEQAQVGLEVDRLHLWHE